MGTVIFQEGSVTLGTGTLIGGTAAFITNGLSMGNHTITAVYGGAAAYEGSASGNAIQRVNRATAAITLANLSQTYDGTPKSASAITTPPGLAVNLTYEGSATAPINAGSYAVVGTINDANYTGTASGTLVIGKASQTITFGALPAKVLGDAPFALSASASSGLPVSFTSSVASVARISGTTLTVVGVGSTTITASQPGNGNYLAAAAVPQTLIVSGVAPIIITHPQLTSQGFTVEVATMPGFSYTLEYKNIVTDANWSVSQKVTGDGTTKILADTTASIAARFYRIRGNEAQGSNLFIQQLPVEWGHRR